MRMLCSPVEVSWCFGGTDKCNVVDKTTDMSSHQENQSLRHTSILVLPINKSEITAIMYMHISDMCIHLNILLYAAVIYCLWIFFMLNIVLPDNDYIKICQNLERRVSIFCFGLSFLLPLFLQVVSFHWTFFFSWASGCPIETHQK